MLKACSICDELRMSDKGRFASVLTDEKLLNALFAESPQHAIIPSIGPVAQGHSLLVSKRHRKSIFYQLPASGTADILQLLERFAGVAAFRGAECVFCFEHGMTSVSSCKSLCSTEHAHLHLVPLSHEIAREVLGSVSAPSPELGMHEFPKMIASFSEYFCCFIYEHGKENFHSKFLPGVNLPSQYGRMIVSNVLGKPDWDWKKNTNPAEIISTIVQYNFSTNTRVF